MHALKRGRRLFGSVDQAKTDSVDRKYRGEKQPEQKEGDENLGEGHSPCAAVGWKFHVYHNESATFRRQAGQLRNLRRGMYVDRAMRIFLQAIISPLDSGSLSNKKGGDWRQEETPLTAILFSPDVGPKDPQQKVAPFSESSETRSRSAVTYYELALRGLRAKCC